MATRLDLEHALGRLFRQLNDIDRQYYICALFIMLVKLDWLHFDCRWILHQFLGKSYILTEWIQTENGYPRGNFEASTHAKEKKQNLF